MKYFVEGDEVEVKSGTWPKSTNGALKESIRKWEWLVEWLEKNPKENAPFASVDSCALCHLFYKVGSNDQASCDGCPVFEKTRGVECRLTPYISYSTNSGRYADGRQGVALAAARKEVEFLKSLL